MSPCKRCGSLHVSADDRERLGFQMRHRSRRLSSRTSPSSLPSRAGHSQVFLYTSRVNNSSGWRNHIGTCRDQPHCILSQCRGNKNVGVHTHSNPPLSPVFSAPSYLTISAHATYTHHTAWNISACQRLHRVQPTTSTCVKTPSRRYMPSRRYGRICSS